MDIPKKLKEARQKAGFTQSKLAAKLGISKRNLLQKEKGDRQTSTEMFFR
jgi:DNA-binding XRE family transcriptional regulator